MPLRSQKPRALKAQVDKKPNVQREVYFCRTVNPILVRVPETPAVCLDSFLYPAPWKKMTVTFYTKVTKPVPVHKAFICAMRYEKHVYYTNLIGDPFTTPTIEVTAIDPKSCREYMTAMKCPQGPLKHRAGKLFTTDIPLDPPVEFPGAFEGLFVGSRTANSTNCLLEEVALSVNSYDLSLYSPSHSVRHCRYKDNSCIISHPHGNMTLIWTGEWTRPCRYNVSRRVTGTFNKDHFRSDDHHIVLTFNEDPYTLDTDCRGKGIKIDTQGQAILRSEYEAMQSKFRPKRDTATTEDLATELTAEEYNAHQRTVSILRLICPTLVSQRPDATLTARKVMKRKNVMGKWRSPTLLEVFQCTTIDMRDLEFRPTNACTLYTPYFLNSAKVGKVSVFLNPFSNILSYTSPEADCRLHDRHYRDVTDGVQVFDNHLNRTSDILEGALVHYTLTESPEVFKAEDFHDLILSSDGETI